MAVKRLIEAGESRLKNKNKPIANFRFPTFKRLIKNLIDSMHHADLIGIAAPQIGKNHMVFITHPRNTQSRKLIKPDKLRIYINPIITYASKKTTIIHEGCGSLGDVFGPVLRPQEIEVQALDENDNKFKLRCDGILARVIQHEYDHLMGIEFIEKVSDYRRIITKNHYEKQVRGSKQQKQNSHITKIEYKLV